MKILFLTNNPNALPLAEWIKEQGERVTICEDHAQIEDWTFRLVVSYNYRKIIEPKYFRKPGVKFINLHISYLPWNGGAYPTVWALLEGTPIGVTIHWMTPEVDGGAIIAQREIGFSGKDTLRGIYDFQQAAIQALFKQEWENIKRRLGTYHSAADFEKVSHLLVNGWETTVDELRGKK